jgi:formylglycine-generating enzyme required for sulfatase activity
VDNGGCDVNAICANAPQPGDAPACTCVDGFSGDGQACTDIDECLEGTAQCTDPNSECVNIPNGYTCPCVAGHQDGGDGVCTAAGTCSPGFRNGGASECVPEGTCSIGYIGTSCEACDVNYEFNNVGECVATVPAGMTLIPTGPSSLDPFRREVTLPAFLIDITEVTASKYRECVEAGSCEYTGSTTDTRRTYNNSKEDHPINFVNHAQASAYCAYEGKSLPTFDQWGKAAVGGCDIWTDSCSNTGFSDQVSCEGEGHDWIDCAQQTPIYPWGDATTDLEQRANYWNSGIPTVNGTTPVGYFDGLNADTIDSPSPYGLYDMAGNVWEWTTDASGLSKNDVVARGGFYGSLSGDLRSGTWVNADPSSIVFSVEFRCAHSTPAPQG